MKTTIVELIRRDGRVYGGVVPGPMAASMILRKLQVRDLMWVAIRREMATYRKSNRKLKKMLAARSPFLKGLRITRVKGAQSP